MSKDYQLIGARYQLSTIEQKLVLSIISLIQPTDTDFMHYQIPLNNFDNLIENNNHYDPERYISGKYVMPIANQKRLK